jgi:uncharacterized protein (DUF736 family)
VQQVQAPACHQPSRPRWARARSIEGKYHGKYRFIHEDWRNEYKGEIVTMSVQTKNVRIVPEDARDNENAPTHRVFVGRAEIGAAWAKTSNEGRDYLSVKLDDPSFTAPIFANLFDDEDGKTFNLIWSRARRSNGD